ncbi:DUF1304 domain-containing protein [Weissella cibaria]|uniref:DUF1304 domain-containing protein n=1 Tax=Weissella cibaria TaxID=137591 RepID=UPI00223AABF1|nr:DUF1304 domain-containing protein [Weissella cibaria]MCT0020000.1 DUF1304 domain-containing protein [Weissella cibaria]
MIGIILTALVALEALYIMGLEMFGSPKKQAETFELEEEFTKVPEVRSLLGNQGIYNGMLGVLILLTMVVLNGAAEMTMLKLFMAYIIVVAIYGSMTAAKKIILVQGLPAALALLALILHI